MTEDRGVMENWRILETCLKQRKDINGKATKIQNQIWRLVNNIVQQGWSGVVSLLCLRKMLPLGEAECRECGNALCYYTIFFKIFFNETRSQHKILGNVQSEFF